MQESWNTVLRASLQEPLNFPRSDEEKKGTSVASSGTRRDAERKTVGELVGSYELTLLNDF